MKILKTLKRIITVNCLREYYGGYGSCYGDFKGKIQNPIAILLNCKSCKEFGNNGCGIIFFPPIDAFEGYCTGFTKQGGNKWKNMSNERKRANG